jgi:methane monooxygenase PmoA-like
MTLIRTAASLIVTALLLTVVSGAPAPPERVNLTRHGNQIDVSVGGRPFTTYYFDPAQAKPYLQPLRTATGTVVSRGFPVGNDVPDAHVRDRSLEPHQRDLYFAHGDINGVNFWAEEAFGRFYGQPSMPFGRTTFRKLESVKSGKESGSIRAAFALEATGRGVMGTEIQEYTFSGDARTRRIDCAFTVRADHGPLTIADTKEGTFAIRVAPELNSPPGHMVNSRGGAGEPEIWGRQAEWVDYSGTIGGDEVGIAIFDDPANFRHPTYWHARGYGLFSVNPFGLRAFTRDPKADGSHAIAAGASLTLRYRVVIHPGDAAQAGIADEYRRFTDARSAGRR